MRSQIEIDKILKAVQHRLDLKRDATGINLHVPQGGFTNDDDWLNVIVTPSASAGTIRASQYVETLSDVEQELKGDGINNVLLVPAIVD